MLHGSRSGRFGDLKLVSNFDVCSVQREVSGIDETVAALLTAVLQYHFDVDAEIE